VREDEAVCDVHLTPTMSAAALLARYVALLKHGVAYGREGLLVIAPSIECDGQLRGLWFEW